MRISDWSPDVCSTDLRERQPQRRGKNDGRGGLQDPLPHDCAKPCLCEPRPDQPTDQSMAAAGRDAKPHVMMFQLIAPISAPNMTLASTMSASTIPLPTVSATCRPKKRKAMKLKKAAQATA